jgi:hypothetical protein
MMGLASAPEEEKEFHRWLLDQVTQLKSNDDSTAIEAALILMKMAFEKRVQCVNGMADGLLAMLDKNGPAAHAGAWALGWLSREDKWTAKPNETGKLIGFISNPSSDIEAARWAANILGNTKDPRAVEPLIKKMEEKNIEVHTIKIKGQGKISNPMSVKLHLLKDKNVNMRTSAIDALGEIGDPQAVEPLLKRLADEEADVRIAALAALAKICEDETDRKLLTRHFDGDWSWLDPQDPVDEKRVKDAARKLELSEADVRHRYERLAEKYHLKLEWKVD